MKISKYIVKNVNKKNILKLCNKKYIVKKVNKKNVLKLCNKNIRSQKK